jgi:hypothetical protein
MHYFTSKYKLMISNHHPVTGGYIQKHQENVIKMAGILRFYVTMNQTICPSDFMLPTVTGKRFKIMSSFVVGMIHDFLNFLSF